MKLPLFVFTIILSFHFTSWGQRQLYISPSGSDSNPGTIQKPIATFKQLQNLIVALEQKDSAFNNGLEVIFLGGTYKFSETVNLKSNHFPIIFRSGKSEKVIFTTGIQVAVKGLPDIKNQNTLQKFQPAIRRNVKEIDLNLQNIPPSKEWPDKFRGYAGWPEIYSDDKPLNLSRWPNSGFAKIDSVIEKGTASDIEGIRDTAGIFIYKEENPSNWDDSKEIFLDGFWCYKWYDEVLKVDRINRDKKQIFLAAHHNYKIGGPSGGLYYAMNLIEELDLPGEYVFDRRENKIYLLLPEYANQESILNISYATNEMFNIDEAENISFEGIVFCNHSGNVFHIENSSNVIIRNCTFKNISRTAVNIEGGERCGLENSHLFNIGESGVVLDGGKRETLKPSAHFATNCHVHHYARHQKTYCPAFLIKGVGQRVIANYIHHAPHNAILFWGNDHLIAKNRIEKVCLNTSDAGAIYTGRDWTYGGTIIRQNYISHLGAASHHHNWGIYLDDMVAGIEVSENIIANSPSGILVGGGRSNVIKDNLIINAPLASIIFDARAIGWAKYHVEKKTGTMWERLYAVPYTESPWKKRFPYLLDIENDKPAEPRNNVVRDNLYCNSASAKLHRLVKTKGEVKNNLYYNEKFEVEILNGKIQFDPSLKILSRFEKIKFKCSDF